MKKLSILVLVFGLFAGCAETHSASDAGTDCRETCLWSVNDVCTRPGPVVCGPQPDAGEDH